MGEIDLSNLCRHGVFKSRKELACFETARIALAGGITCGDDIELCPDALLMQFIG